MRTVSLLAGPLHHSHRPACSGRLDCNLVVLRTGELRWALLSGIVALLVALFALRAWRGWLRSFGWGTLAVAAFLVGLAASGHMLPSTAVGLSILVAGGALADHRRWSLLPRLLVLAPGATVLLDAPALQPLQPMWAKAAVPAVVVVAAATSPALGRITTARRPTAGLIAVSAVGLYAAVPNTDFAIVLVGAVVPFAILSAITRDIPVGGGAAGLVGCVGLVAIVGGYGRPSAIVAGLACLGIFSLGPAATALARRARVGTPRDVTWVVVGHVLLVAVAARLIGRLPRPGAAAVVWLAADALVFAVGRARLDRRFAG